MYGFLSLIVLKRVPKNKHNIYIISENPKNAIVFGKQSVGILKNIPRKIWLF
jgi:hypothetical protein